MKNIEWEYHNFEKVQSEEKPLVKSNQFNNQLVYMASSLARQLHFTDNEEKLFAMAVSQLDFFNEGQNFSVDIRVKDVQEKLNLAKDEAFYTNLRKQYRSLMKKAAVSFELGNEEKDWLEGNLIRAVKSNKRKGSLTIIFDDLFKPALHYCKLAYTKIPLDDTLAYNSRYAIILQRWLTTMYRTSEKDPLIQTFDFTTKQLKEMFGLSVDDYCYKTGENKGKFKRTEFEKRTLQVACDEIMTKSQVMRVEWKKERIRGTIHYLISCTIATKIKKEPKVYDMSDAEYRAKYADQEEAAGQTSIYNWLEE